MAGRTTPATTKEDMVMAIDKELQAMFDELRGNIGKSVEVLPKIDALEKRALAGDASLSESKKAVEELRGLVEKQRTEIEEIRKASRVQAISMDGVRQKEEGKRILGMMVRQRLAEHLHVEIPSMFSGERASLDDYRKRATLNAGAVTGSYLLPTVTSAEILEAVEEISSLLALTDFMPGLPGKMTIPTLTGRPSLKPTRATIDTAATASDPTIGQISFDPNEAYVFFPIDNRLIEMAPQDLGSWALNLTRDAIIEGLTNWLLSADGTSTFNSNTGFLNESTAAYVYTLPAGKMAFSDLTVADLRGAKKQCYKRGRARGRWVMALDVLGLAEDMNREGKAPVVTYAQDGSVRVLQNPVEIDEGMPDLGDSAKSKAFIGYGDLATYLVGLVGGIQLAVSDQVYFNKMQTCFRGVINGAIVRKPVPTFITIKTPAA